VTSVKKIGVRESVAAPVDTVWALVGDFGGLANWAPVEACSIEGEGVGAVRTVTGRGPFGREMIVQERLESMDADRHEMTYSIVGKSPLPASDYLGRIALEADGDDKCTVDWSCTLQPKIPAFLLAYMIKGVYRSGIDGIRKQLGSG